MSDDLATLVEQAAGKLKARIPRATYRMQFNKDFTFKDAEALVPYLDALGISDLYTSPILKAIPGSMHGYDICDPRQLNPELGTAEDFARLCEALRSYGMGLIMDIVPNHMGIDGDYNAWWMDVLENGTNSAYVSFFDIDWNPVKPELKDKVLLPILGDQYGNVLESGSIKLEYTGSVFELVYGERHLPIMPATYSLILDDPASYLVIQLGEGDARVQELQSILVTLKYLAAQNDPASNEAIKQRVAALYSAHAEVRRAVGEALVKINGTVGDAQSFDALDALINAQAYRPAFWRVAAEEINYRRFFDIDTMAAVRVELPEVFEATHDLILQLLAKGQVTGVRIDHPDGLWNPPGYFRRLQEQFVKRVMLAQMDEALSANQVTELENAVAAWFDQQYRDEGKFTWPLYAVAEKILSESEPLPLDWAVYGTTGYDFMSLVNSLFVDNAQEARLNDVFSSFTSRGTNFSRQEYASKKMIMHDSLASEINLLAHRLERLSERNRHTRDFTAESLLYALREVIACLPIYRTYITGIDTLSPRDRQFVEEAVRDAKRRNPRLAETIFDFIRDTLLLSNVESFAEADRQGLIDFVMRVQQITPPVMAKSVEDTLFYSYNRLVSVNEVGSSPAMFGISPEQFAEENTRRCRTWPNAMLATSTHDTKRSEDVRARLNVLSEMPSEWSEALEAWSRINAEHKVMGDSGPAPSANDEYLLYQTLLGTYLEEAVESYSDRIAAYMAKATKEAKVNTSWTNANATYDQAVEQFVRTILDSEAFMQAFLPLQRRVAFLGRFNSLSQTLLKLTCPGVPDTYRGTEVWDFSLVDPDNRRPVDYARNRDLLENLQVGQKDRAGLADDLLAQAEDGRIKLYILETVLAFRRKQPNLFIAAPYETVEAQGTKKEHVCAFTRVYEGVGVLVIVPRLVAGLSDGAEVPPMGEVWDDTALILPKALVGKTARNLFTGEMVTLDENALLATLLRRFPVGLFELDLNGV